MEGEFLELKQKFPEIAWAKNKNKTKQKTKQKEKLNNWEIEKLSRDKIVFEVHDVSSCVLKIYRIWVEQIIHTGNSS